MFDTPLDIERSFGHSRSVARTYVRRRIAATLVLGTVLTIVLTGPVAAALGSDGAPDPTAERTYVVRSGDTLWAIAHRLAPGADPRVTVLAIEAANAVDGSSLTPGEILRLPATS
jgi:Tfp pilus assembly protein FimV